MAIRLGQTSLQQNTKNAGRNIVIANLMFPTIPLLEFQVNPNSLNFTLSKQITEYETIGARIEEHWGHDALTNISGSGKTLAFVDYGSLDSSVAQGNRLLPGVEGHDSPAARNFHEIIQMYLNAGSQYNSKGQVDLYRGLMLIYDGDIYFGHFDSLSFNETAESPFNWSYNFNFKVTFQMNQRSVL